MAKCAWQGCLPSLLSYDALQVLGKDHVIKGLKLCDFTPMYEHAMAEREKKKALPKEVNVPLVLPYKFVCQPDHGA